MKRCPECGRNHDDTLVRGLVLASIRRVFVSLALLLVTAIPALAQQAAQNPSPMTDTTRPHPRIAKVEVPGRRTELATLKGAILFGGPNIKLDKPVPLIIHFHGVSWLME